MNLATLLLSLIALGAPAVPINDPPETPVLANPWLRIQALRAEEDSAAPDNPALPEASNIDARIYALLEFTPEELLRAAKEAARQAASRTRFKPWEDTHREATFDLHQCLEFYPLVVNGPEDFDAVINLIPDPEQELVCRVFLLEHCIPEWAPRCLFSDYLQEHIKETSDFSKRLWTLVRTASDEPRMLALCMGALYEVLYSNAMQVLETDPEAVRIKAESGEAPRLRALIEPPAFTPSRATKSRIRRPLDELSALAHELSVYVVQQKSPSPEVRQTAIDIVGRLCREAPLSNREEAEAFVREYSSTPAPGE